MYSTWVSRQLLITPLAFGQKTEYIENDKY